jgi:hypothetical protein
MSKRRLRTVHTLPSLTLVMTLLGGLAIAAAGCGGDGAKDFGGGDSGGRSGGVGTGGAAASTGGATAASGGHVGSGGATGTGTGGTDATGGATASGGAIGSGGRAASGGTSASGGAAATGGRSGSGGVMGTGGTSGTGGVTASGGATGTGGRAGTGGAPGTGGAAAMCDAIAADYQAQLPSARACNTITGLTVPQCQVMAPSALGCGSNCIIYVQDNEKLTEIQKRWNGAGCPSMIRACPAVACIEAKPGNCYATTTGGAALCQTQPRN